MKERIKEAFDSIHAETELKEQTKAFLASKIRESYQPRPFRRQVAYSAAVCLFCLFVGFGGYRLYFSQVALISIDINPSIELSVNRFDKVISLKSYNEEGEALASMVNVQYMDYQKAFGQLLEAEPIAGCVRENGLLSISVVGNSQKKGEQMLQAIESTLPSQSHVCCSLGNFQEVEEAHAAGLSVGKYHAFLELQQEHPEVTVTAEELKGLTMREIRDLFSSANEDTDGTDTKQHKRKHRHRHGTEK